MKLDKVDVAIITLLLIVIFELGCLIYIRQDTMTTVEKLHNVYEEWKDSPVEDR